MVQRAASSSAAKWMLRHRGDSTASAPPNAAASGRHVMQTDYEVYVMAHQGDNLLCAQCTQSSDNLLCTIVQRVDLKHIAADSHVHCDCICSLLIVADFLTQCRNPLLYNTTQQSELMPMPCAQACHQRVHIQVVRRAADDDAAQDYVSVSGCYSGHALV